jgi:protein involved in polysaccharide export with SLBB domain
MQYKQLIGLAGFALIVLAAVSAGAQHNTLQQTPPQLGTPSNATDITRAQLGTPSLPKRGSFDDLGILDDRRGNRTFPRNGESSFGKTTPAAISSPLLDTNAPLGYRPQSQPYGSNLFQNQFLVGRTQGVNPNYSIGPGDQIAVNIWGARTFNGVLTVDLQGKIFIPEVGPVHVGGLPNNQINDAVRSALRRVFTDNVDAYTNLLNAQPVSVFVTGAVPRPGRYPGDRFDSLLYFLSQAGGPDPLAGSFRNITIRRNGHVLAQVDLYEFLVNGKLPILQFADNDTIIVGPRGATVEVQGDVRNPYIFEVAPQITTGQSLMSLAQPTPAASHVGIRGLRNGEPYTAYLPLEKFASVAVEDGDQYVFQTDRVDQAMFVTVTGQTAGPSTYTVRRGALLGELLDLIPADPNIVVREAIYLRRRSVAERQKRALDTALQELQRSTLTTSSSTESQAAIRIQEAQLIERFVSQVRANPHAQPEGRVVLANRPGSRDMRLEPDDEIVIPHKSDVVLVSGEVRMPQSVLFQSGKTAADYVADSGGYTERSDQSRFIVLRQNGVAEVGDNSIVINPGDHVMVLPRVDSKGFGIFKDIVEVIYRIAVSSGIVIRVLDDN